MEREKGCRQDRRSFFYWQRTVRGSLLCSNGTLTQQSEFACLEQGIAVPYVLQSEFACMEQGVEVPLMLQSEFAHLEQGYRGSIVLQSEFACLESGFTGTSSQIAAISGHFRTTNGSRCLYATPNGQNRTTRRRTAASFFCRQDNSAFYRIL